MFKELFAILDQYWLWIAKHWKGYMVFITVLYSCIVACFYRDEITEKFNKLLKKKES